MAKAKFDRIIKIFEVGRFGCEFLKMKNLNLILPILILAVAALACDKTSDTEENKSGRLNFVKELRYGSVGSHGSQGWYVTGQYFLVNGKRWSPDGIKVEDISSCSASPNEQVEALKCYTFSTQKNAVFVLRMKDDKPEWINASGDNYGGGYNDGLWVGDGKWLLFLNYYFNVETSEKREIKGLPDYPLDYFRATSPDMETIMYEESAFGKRYDLPAGSDNTDEIHRQYQVFNDHRAKGIRAFWLIDTKTGKTKLLELDQTKYDWSYWNNTKYENKQAWLAYFRKQLVWEKDKTGQYQLTYPN